MGPRRLNCALVLKGPEGVGWGWVGEAAESWRELGRVGGFGSLGAGEAELEMRPLTLEAWLGGWGRWMRSGSLPGHKPVSTI